MDFVISPTDIFVAIANLPHSNVSSADGITKSMLKAGAIPLSGPIAELVVLIMDTAQLPDLLEIIEIISLPKNNSFLIPVNNRPIALESELWKVIQGCVLKIMVKYLEKMDRPTPSSQFGYTSGKSVVFLLLIHWTKILDLLSRYNCCTISHWDMLKAFEKIPSHTQIYHFFSPWNKNRALKFFAWLTNRRQRTRVGQSFSTLDNLTSGCIQGM